MMDENLRAAYGPLVRRGGPHGAACPSVEALVAAVRREGPEEQRLATVNQALRCPACRRELELLRSVERAADEADRADARPVLRFRRPRIATLALAAMLLIAVGVGVGRRPWDRGAADDVVRAPAGGVVLLAPADGAALTPPPTLAWRAVPGARRYVVEVVTEGGAVALRAPTTDTVLAASATSGIVPGEYRWAVRAQLTGGVELRSDARRLRIRSP